MSRTYLVLAFPQLPLTVRMERTSILGLSEHTLASQASSPPGSVDATPGKGTVACLVNQYSY